MTRLSIHVSDDTNRRLRRFLGEIGGKKGDLSSFVERAVNREIFHQTVRDVQERNLQFPPEQIEADIEEAIRAVRAENRSGHQRISE
jgi:hypothetical protein